MSANPTKRQGLLCYIITDISYFGKRIKLEFIQTKKTTQKCGLAFA